MVCVKLTCEVSTIWFKMASTTACHKRKGNADEDSNCDGNDDISEWSDVTDFAINEWWQLREELNNYPDFIHMKDLKQQKRSSILRYVYQAQLFEEKFGLDALSDHQKQRRNMYERAAQLKVAHYEEEECDERNVVAKKPRVDHDLIEGMHCGSGALYRLPIWYPKTEETQGEGPNFGGCDTLWRRPGGK